MCFLEAALIRLRRLELLWIARIMFILYQFWKPLSLRRRRRGPLWIVVLPYYSILEARFFLFYLGPKWAVLGLGRFTAWRAAALISQAWLFAYTGFPYWTWRAHHSRASLRRSVVGNRTQVTDRLGAVLYCSLRPWAYLQKLTGTAAEGPVPICIQQYFGGAVLFAVSAAQQLQL